MGNEGAVYPAEAGPILFNEFASEVSKIDDEIEGVEVMVIVRERVLGVTVLVGGIFIDLLKFGEPDTDP